MSETESRLHPDQEISVDGKCPEPVLKSARSLRGMQSGEILKVICLDPVSVHDLKAFSDQTGNVLLAQETEEEAGAIHYIHWLRKR